MAMQIATFLIYAIINEPLLFDTEKNIEICLKQTCD